MNTTNSLISVIIPAYNHERYIQETISSIINQSYKNIELLIIDDGSTDLTLEKIQGFKEICEKRFVRFFVQSQNNQGVINTANHLIELSQGEYIYLIASDDVASPDAIKKLYDFLSQNYDYALAVGENKLIDENSQQCYWDKNRNTVYNIEECFYSSYSDFLMKWSTNIDFFSDEFGSYPMLLLGNHIPNGYLIRKSIFEKTGLFTKNAPLEDYYIMLQIAKYAKMKFIPKPLFYYRWHGTNSVKQKNKLSAWSKVTRRHEMKLVEQSNNPQIKKYMRDYLNSFPKLHILKIPFILEVYKIITPCVEQTKIKFLGFLFVINTKKL